MRQVDRRHVNSQFQGFASTGIEGSLAWCHPRLHSQPAAIYCPAAGKMQGTAATARVTNVATLEPQHLRRAMRCTWLLSSTPLGGARTCRVQPSYCIALFRAVLSHRATILGATTTFAPPLIRRPRLIRPLQAPSFLRHAAVRAAIAVDACRRSGISAIISINANQLSKIIQTASNYRRAGRLSHEHPQLMSCSR